MPRLSVWFIRSALLYLGVGFTLGALILFQKGVPYDGAVWGLLLMHIEFLLIGWTVQLAMGMGFWTRACRVSSAARRAVTSAWSGWPTLRSMPVC